MVIRRRVKEGTVRARIAQLLERRSHFSRRDYVADFSGRDCVSRPHLIFLTIGREEDKRARRGWSVNLQIPSSPVPRSENQSPTDRRSIYPGRRRRILGGGCAGRLAMPWAKAQRGGRLSSSCSRETPSDEVTAAMKRSSSPMFQADLVAGGAGTRTSREQGRWTPGRCRLVVLLLE